MKKLTVGMRSAAIALGFLALPSCTIKAENLVPVGRYQISSADSHLYRCDTITGEVTRYSRGKWSTVSSSK